MNKVIIFLLLGLMVINMGVMIFTGIKNTLTVSPETSKIHILGARILLVLTVILVVFIEWGVRARGGLQMLDALFYFHIVCSVLFFILLLFLNFWVTGERSPFHALVAYAATAVFVGMVASGIPLVLRIPKF